MNQNKTQEIAAYAHMAAQTLAQAGIAAHMLKCGTRLVWADGTGEHTLVVIAQESEPLLVRLSVDYYGAPLPRKIALAMGRNKPTHCESVQPLRENRREITLMPGEVGPALAWALSGADRATAPFDLADVGDRYYLFSVKAWDVAQAVGLRRAQQARRSQA